MPAKDISGGETQILNVHPIWRISCHPIESDVVSTPEIPSDTEDWLNWTGNLDNASQSADDSTALNDSDIEHNNSIADPECPKPQDVSALENVPKLVQPTR